MRKTRTRPVRAARVLTGDGNGAAHAIGSKLEIDRPAELIRNEIADDGDAVALLGWNSHNRATLLMPFEH